MQAVSVPGESDLLRRYEPIARRIASSFTRGVRCGAKRDDVYSDALLGLLSAIRRQDANEAKSFEGLVASEVRGRCLDGIKSREHSQCRRRLSFVCFSEMRQSPDVATAAAPSLDEFREGFERATRMLSERHRDILRRRYIDGEKITDIANHFGLTLERVSQILSESIELLRQNEAITREHLEA